MVSRKPLRRGAVAAASVNAYVPEKDVGSASPAVARKPAREHLSAENHGQ